MRTYGNSAALDALRLRFYGARHVGRLLLHNAAVHGRAERSEARPVEPLVGRRKNKAPEDGGWLPIIITNTPA